MNNIRFNYLYRDGANFKSWNDVIFTNPERLTLEEIQTRLIDSFLPDRLFIADQISVPEKFLFLEGKFTRFDHCYHEFDSVEVCKENPTDSLGRSINDFLKVVEQASKQDWEAFDVFDRA